MLEELLVIRLPIAKFILGVACLSTIITFTFSSVGSSLSGDPTLGSVLTGYGGNLVAYRIGMLLVLILVLFLHHRVWSHVIQTKWRMCVSPDDQWLYVVVVGLIAASCADQLGYTPLLGAFLAGASIPFSDNNDNGLRTITSDRMRWVVRWILLPQYFTNVGLLFDLRSIRASEVGMILLCIFIAFLCKGTPLLFARFVLRYSWRDSLFLYALMCCRGFLALVVASAGRKNLQLAGPSYVTMILISVLSTANAAPMGKYFKPSLLPPNSPEPLSPNLPEPVQTLVIHPPPASSDRMSDTNCDTNGGKNGGKNGDTSKPANSISIFPDKANVTPKEATTNEARANDQHGLPKP